VIRQASTEFEVRTRGKGLYEFTRAVENWVRDQRMTTGLLTLFCKHTSASLLIQENADPDVQRDMAEYFERAAPEGEHWQLHTLEGPDDMPAHIRAALTNTQLSIPLAAGELSLGTWQGIYVFEHRRSAHRRLIAAHLMGE
jgi:secondary thiamine-phosphate synthase enzyme